MFEMFKNNGVTFGNKHSYTDFGLYPLYGGGISPPEVDEKIVEIPGSSTLLDLTDALTDSPQYYGRKGEFPFKIIGSNAYCEAVHSRVMAHIHGKRMEVIKDDEKIYYYTGRLQVGKLDKRQGQAYFNITGTFDPYKIELTSTVEPWIWDTFNFEDGVIREYYDLMVDGTLNVTVIGSVMPIVPLFNVESNDGNGMTLIVDGISYQLTDGENRLPEIVLENGEYPMEFVGNGSVTIEFTVGRL